MVFYCASKKRLFLLGLIFFILMSISGIYSLSNEVINSTESKMSTSYVDIELKEYRDGVEYTKDNETVMPGEDISLNPRINNLGIDCYLRAKITYIIDGKEYDEKDYINGNYKNWNKNEDYYYYGSVLKSKESVSLFDTIHIPEELDNSSSGTLIVVHILVEAIQAKHFDGEWNGIEIEKAVDRSYSIDSSGGFEVIFENNAQAYIDLGDGFFGNLGGLLPGDSISDKVTIENDSKNKIKYYLSVDTKGLTQDEKDLFDNIHLVIKNSSDKVLSDGKLTDVNNLVLGTYVSGESDDIHFEISVPKNLKNKYSKLMTKVLWIFSLEMDEGTPINPNTWDLKFDLSIIVFFISAIGLLVVMILEKRENDNIEKNK